MIQTVTDKYAELTALAPSLMDQCSDHAKYIEDRYLVCMTKMVTAQAARAQPAAVNAPPTSGAARGAVATKLKTNLQPPDLQKDSTWMEMEHWASKFKAYYSMSGLENTTVENQREVFFGCLSTKLESAIRHMCAKDTKIFGGAGTCMGFLKEIFEQNNPLNTRRLAFMTDAQDKGQPCSEWIDRLEQLGGLCDLSGL